MPHRPRKTFTLIWDSIEYQQNNQNKYYEFDFKPSKDPS